MIKNVIMVYNRKVFIFAVPSRSLVPGVVVVECMGGGVAAWGGGVGD